KSKDSADKLVFYTCPGNAFSFNLPATTQGSMNVLTMESNSDLIIPASTFTVAGSGGVNPVATFSWTPTFADIGDHTFVITAKDSTCTAAQPIVLKSFKVITIKVLYGLSAGPDLLICPETSKQIMASGPPDLTYVWSPATGLSNPNTLAPIAGPATTTQYILTTPD